MPRRGDVMKTIDTESGKLVQTCLFCSHFYFDGGSPGHSEYTPGSDASIGCSKGVWDYEMYDMTNDFRRHMLTAQTCDKFSTAELDEATATE